MTHRDAAGLHFKLCSHKACSTLFSELNWHLEGLLLQAFMGPKGN